MSTKFAKIFVLVMGEIIFLPISAELTGKLRICPNILNQLTSCRHVTDAILQSLIS